MSNVRLVRVQPNGRREFGFERAERRKRRKRASVGMPSLVMPYLALAFMALIMAAFMFMFLALMP